MTLYKWYRFLLRALRCCFTYLFQLVALHCFISPSDFLIFFLFLFPSFIQLMWGFLSFNSLLTFVCFSLEISYAHPCKPVTWHTAKNSTSALMLYVLMQTQMCIWHISVFQVAFPEVIAQKWACWENPLFLLGISWYIFRFLFTYVLWLWLDWRFYSPVHRGSLFCKSVTRCCFMNCNLRILKLKIDKTTALNHLFYDCR